MEYQDRVYLWGGSVSNWLESGRLYEPKADRQKGQNPGVLFASTVKEYPLGFVRPCEGLSEKDFAKIALLEIC